ncbi:MAG: chorismate mutase [Bacteroidetes bacterium]|jgi:chorismate mutase-like protein|nr:chorismate mutase [Bacteroidota bacterium]
MLVETLQDTLRQLEEALPEETGPEASSDDLRPWRDRIDAIDRAIVHLLNERSRSANIIGHIKKQLDMSVYVPSREKDVIANATNANGGPLPNAAVRRIFERMIDETRALERQKYQDEEDLPNA